MREFAVMTSARCQLVNIDNEVRDAVRALGVENGTVTVFCPHTTAAITINENADPDVCHDLIENLNRLVPANQPYYRHGEGNSDAHLKASLVGSSVQILIENGRPVLGTWQSIYFAEFDGPRTRKVWVSR